MQTEQGIYFFLWYFAHLFISLDKLLALDNEKKINFSFALCSLNRNFANKLAKILRLGIKNKCICFVLLSTFRIFAT